MNQPPTDRTRLRRRAQRGHYDAATIHSILDAGLIAHVSFSVAGRPFCTPTLHWRIGSRVYFHGAPAGGMIRHVRGGAEVCLVVSIIDGLVLARSAFHHSVNYRSVVVFGAPVVEDGANKAAALEAFVEGLYPGRSLHIRPPNDKELAATSVLSLALDEASAKIRAAGVADDDADMALPVWAGVVPTALTVGAPEPDAGCGDTDPGYPAALGRALRATSEAD